MEFSQIDESRGMFFKRGRYQRVHGRTLVLLSEENATPKGKRPAATKYNSRMALLSMWLLSSPRWKPHIDISLYQTSGLMLVTLA